MSEKIFEGKDKLDMDLIEPMEPIEVHEITKIDRKNFTATVRTSKGDESTKPIIDLIKECLVKPEWKKFPEFEDFAGKCPERPKFMDAKNLTAEQEEEKQNYLKLCWQYNGNKGKNICGLKNEYKSRLAKNNENCKKDEDNREKNLNLLFVNFVDGFLKDGKAGAADDDWVHISKLFYKNDFSKDPEFCGNDTINDLKLLKSLLEGDSAYGILSNVGAAGLGARKNRSFAISSPVLDQTGFHNDVFKKLVSTGEGMDNKIIENMEAGKLPDVFKEINGVKFGAADGKFIIDNLKLASGFTEEDLKNCKCEYKGKNFSDAERLLNFIFDMSEKGKKIKNYNAAAILVFFAIIACSKAEKIINETFEKQKKIYEEVYKTIDSGNPDFSKYENLRHETDVEEKKKTGTFDFRDRLGKAIKKIVDFDVIGNSANELYSELEKILEKKLDGINIDDCDRYEETREDEVESYSLKIYFGDIERYKNHREEFVTNKGSIESGKKPQPEEMNKDSFKAKCNILGNINIKKLFIPDTKKSSIGAGTMSGETRFSEKEVLDSYLAGAKGSPDEKKFIEVYKALKIGFEKLEILKTDGSFDSDEAKDLGEHFGNMIDNIEKDGKIKDLDGKFKTLTTLCYLNERCPGFWVNFKNAIFSRAASWYFDKNIANKKYAKLAGLEQKAEIAEKKKLLPNSMLKTGDNAPKEFGDNVFDKGDLGADLLKLEDIFNGKENPCANPFSYEGDENKTKKKTSVRGTSPLEYYLSAFKLDDFKGLDNKRKEDLYSQLLKLSSENKVNELEKGKLDPVLSPMKAIIEENIFNSFVEGIDNGSLGESSVTTALDTGNFSDEQKKDAAKRLANAININKYKNLVDAVDVTLESLEGNAKFWSGLSKENKLFIFDEDQKKTLDGFIESMGKKHYEMSIQKAFNEEKGKYTSWGISKDPETEGINVSGDGAAQSTINSLNSENTQLKQEKNDLEDKLKKANEQKDTAEKKATDAQKALEDYKNLHPDNGGTGGSTGDPNDKQEIESLKNQLKTAKDEIDKIKNGGGDSEDVNTLKQQLKEAQDDLTKANQKITQLENGGTGPNAKKLQAEYDELKKNYAALLQDQQNVDKKQKEIDELNKKLKDAKNKGEDANKIQKELEEKKKELDSAKSAQNLLNEKEKAIKELSDKYVKLEDEKEKVKAELGKREDELKKLRDLATEGADASTKAVIENLNARTEELEDKLKTLEKEKEKLIEDAKKAGVEVKKIELDDRQIQAIQEGAKDPAKRGKAMEILGAVFGGTGFLAGAGGVALVLIFTTSGTLAFPLLLGGSGLMAVLGGFGFGKSIANLKKTREDEIKDTTNSGVFKLIEKSGIIKKTEPKEGKPKEIKKPKTTEEPKEDKSKLKT